MALPYRIVESKQSFVPATKAGVWETMTNEEARGYCWLFEPPLHTATYVIGVDPAQGITGWDRTIPQDDHTHDNSAIEVFRIGRRDVTIIDTETNKEKIISVPTDYQVAEYAAPVDFEECAKVVNALGRLYRGNGRMGVAHTIIEVYPGPGWMVEKTLISTFGYLNFYQPKYVDTLMPVTAGKGIGWTASQKSVRDLWILGTRHLNRIGATDKDKKHYRSVVLRSPWLLDEMRTTEPVKFLTYTTEAESGFHDDRLRAAMLCFWAAHDFSSMVSVETQTTIERSVKPVNWQMSDMSVESLKDEWERRFRDIGEV